MRAVLLAACAACTVSLFACGEEKSPAPGRGPGPGKLGQPREQPAEQPTYGLRAGAGREHVIANCLPCHSGSIIASNHLTRGGWVDVITLMQKKNGMHPLTPEVRTAILDYLETAQRPDDPGLSQGKKSPWASPLYRPNPLWK